MIDTLSVFKFKGIGVIMGLIEEKESYKGEWRIKKDFLILIKIKFDQTV